MQIGSGLRSTFEDNSVVPKAAPSSSPFVQPSSEVLAHLENSTANLVSNEPMPLQRDDGVVSSEGDVLSKGTLSLNSPSKTKKNRKVVKRGASVAPLAPLKSLKTI